MAQKKETRIMRVILDAEEFKKLNQGMIHSDSGLRTDKGRLSSLPDIAPISEDDIPVRGIVRTEPVYLEPEQSSNDSIGVVIIKAIGNVAEEVLSDSEVQEGLVQLGKAFWYYKVKPRIANAVHRMRGNTKTSAKIASQFEHNRPNGKPSYKIEAISDQECKIPVSEEQAEQLVEALREEARRLSAMIYLLSNITVKNEKTKEEYVIEQAYIKQLVSEESRRTMETLVANKELLDGGTSTCFTDFLNGKIQVGGRKVPVPVALSGNSQ